MANWTVRSQTTSATLLIVVVCLAGCDRDPTPAGNANTPATQNATTAPTQPSSPGVFVRVDLSTPEATIRTLADAIEAGDIAAARAAATDESRELAEATAALGASVRAFDQAARDHFGGGAPTTAPAGPRMLPFQWLRDAEVDTSGPNPVARAKASRLAGSVPLRRVGDAWRADLAANLPRGQDPARAAAMLRQMAPAAGQLAAEVRAGRYPTADQANQAFGARMMQAMQAHLLTAPTTTASDPVR